MTGPGDPGRAHRADAAVGGRRGRTPEAVRVVAGLPVCVTDDAAAGRERAAERVRDLRPAAELPRHARPRRRGRVPRTSRSSATKRRVRVGHRARWPRPASPTSSPPSSASTDAERAAHPRPPPLAALNPSSGDRRQSLAVSERSSRRRRRGSGRCSSVDASEPRNSSAPSSSWASPVRRHRAVAADERRSTTRRRTSRAVISLGNQPGAIAFTRTPLRAHCAASSRVRFTTAPFDAQ